MNTRSLSMFLTGLVVLVCVLTGCAPATSTEPVLSPTRAAVPEATARSTTMPVVRPTVKPTLKAVSTSTVAPTPTVAVSRGATNLVVLGFTESGQKPAYAASVRIYSNGLMTDSGQMKEGEGIYAVALSAGTYDVAITYNSQPPIGYLKKDVVVAAGQSNTVAFNMPTEGKLKVSVYTRNGNAALKNYTVNIATGGEDVLNDSYYSTANSKSLTLRTDRHYTVTVKYGTEELQESNVVVQAGRTQEVKFTLPYDEGELEVYVKSQGQPQLDGNATVIVSDALTGKQVASASYIRDDYSIVLKADTDYKVTVKYKDKTEMRTIRVGAGNVVEETFVYP